MGIGEFFYGKVTPRVINEKTGETDISPEKAKAASKVIRRDNVGKEFGNEKYSAEQNVQAQMREGLEQKAFKALFNGFSDDIEFIRKDVVEYNNTTDQRLRELKGQDILNKGASIKFEIESQIDVTKDIQEKSDFDGLRIELENVIRNVKGLSEQMVANG